MESGSWDPSQPLTAAEEAVKRNTDCVYFLASPLTCKKGSECEYRHSEGARVNPRDCWFWLNGNCLNPKCSFRHPPLDGLLGTPTPSGPALPPPQTTMSTQIPVAHAPAVHTSNKQSIPCYYFQNGSCLKGDKCPFMHGAQAICNPVPQQVPKVATPVAEPPHTSKKPSWGLERCASQQNIEKPVEVTRFSAKPVAKAEIAPTNASASKSNVLPSPLVDEIPPRSRLAYVPVSNAPSRSQCHQAQPLDEPSQNGRETDEFFRESSPGFDVIVDNEREDPDYFCKEDKFGGTSGNGGRNLNPVNDFNYHHSSDYDFALKFEGEAYNEIGEYDLYGRVHDRYSREHHNRSSSERIMERSSMTERRGMQSPYKIDGSDLRHRLLKQRRLNVSRSTVSPDHRREHYQRRDCYVGEQRYQHRNSHRDRRHFPHESSMGNRLRGRITLPGRSSSDNPKDLHSEREKEKGRNWSRSSSPGRTLNYQGRLHDRIKRGHENFTAEARSMGGQRTGGDGFDSLNFSGPRSLAEIKGAKVSDNAADGSTKIGYATVSLEQKNMRLDKALGYQESEASILFEGPKPLSMILKRKREGAPPRNGAVFSSEEEHNERVIEGPRGGSMIAVVTNNQTIHPLRSQKEGNRTLNNIEENKARAVEKEEEEEGMILTDGEELPHQEQSSSKGELLETEDGMIADNVEDHPVLEKYEHSNGEFEHEAVEGGDFMTEDEDAYREDEEDMDDEDGDDFARKLGVMFT